MVNKTTEKLAMKQLNKIDFKQVSKMLSQFDKNFQTLSENQIYMQENQLEFEAYLKAILKNQELILKLLRKDDKDNTIKDINA